MVGWQNYITESFASFYGGGGIVTNFEFENAFFLLYMDMLEKGVFWVLCVGFKELLLENYHSDMHVVVN